MDLRKTADSLLNFLRVLWAEYLYGWVVKRWSAILICSMLGVLVYLCYFEYQRSNTFHIHFFVGNSGGKSAQTARTIHQELEKSGKFLGKTVQLDIHYTSGFKENYDLVHEDIDGNRIGFAYDGINVLSGMGDADNVQTLTPMSWSRLHILVRKGFYNQVKGIKPESRGSAFKSEADKKELERNLQSFMVFAKDVIKHIAKVDQSYKSDQGPKLPYPRFYLGDRRSALRDLSSVIVDQCGIDVAAVADPGGGYSDLPSKFRRKEVDVAFYLGPEDSSIVQRIADSGDCYLVGLSEMRTALKRKFDFLDEWTIPRYSYTANHEFCDTDRQTIRARKVVICPSEMSNQLAYKLGTVINEVVENGRNGLEEESNTKTFFLTHDGAKMIGQTQQLNYQGGCRLFFRY